MARRFKDYGIRPKGSPEIACDPMVLMQSTMRAIENAAASRARRERVAEVFKFIVRIALEILPPKQRQIFYSVWVRSGGNMSKGVMEFSRRKGRSYYTSYNNYYKAIASVQTYLIRSGYEKHIIDYLQGDSDGEELEERFDDDLLQS